MSSMPSHESRITPALRLIMLTSAVLSACSAPRQVTLDSHNKDSRVAVIVIHHTSSDFGESVRLLTERSQRPVSAHYLIPEPGDPSYGASELRVHSLVPETDRAWHAGDSEWKGLNQLNNVSIGIELVNRSYCHLPEDTPTDTPRDWPDEALCFYPDFDDGQLGLLVELLDELKKRHLRVAPTHIVGHSDIAPHRKIDPGPRFPWQRLHRLGHGAWYDDATVARYWEQFGGGMPSIGQVQAALAAYGYRLEQTNVADQQTTQVLRAFQMHFLPWKVTGEPDRETTAVLYALLEKYYPDELPETLGAENSSELSE